ncbi:MAG: hypothetical protein WB729_14180 [Candidatus Sulfotelmatobacter sp.]
MSYASKGCGALALATLIFTILLPVNARSQAANSAAAFVYVSSSTSNGSSQINAYAAAPNGKLTEVSGSPFAEPGSYLAVSRKWLVSTDSVNIYTFSIAASGALTQVSTINAQQFNGYNDGGPVSLFFDRSGATLYDEDIYGNNGANNTYQFFDVNQTTGALSFLGATSSASPEFETPLSFIGSNAVGYGSSCYHGYQTIYGFSRSSDGSLTDLNFNPPTPAAATGVYCPYLAAANTTNNVAVSLTPTQDGMAIIGPAQLGVYSADSSGTLTTTSTYENMPKVGAGSPNAMVASPSGKLLAVAGTKGLQIFHFNGANPITHYTYLLTTDSIDQLSWDNENHLYAISQSAGKLYVFTVTPVSFGQAPGSPYAISSPESVAVLPRM